MNLLKPKPLQSLLGLTIRGRRLTAGLAKRNGTAGLSAIADAELSHPPLAGDPERVGREIRAFLQQHELRENRCLLCLPLNLAMTMSVEIPDLAEDDLQSYLELQAESEFPFSIEDMQLASTTYRAPDQSRHATLAAIPQHHIARIQQILQHARLRPISLTLGLAPAAIESGKPPNKPQLVLDIQPDHVDLSVRCGTGFAVIRSLEEVLDFEQNPAAPDCKLLCREIRITLGQLSGNLRQNLSAATVCHPAGLSQNWKQSLEQSLAEMRFQTAFREGSHPALEAAVKDRLANSSTALEFLPPQRSPLQILAEKASSRRNVWISAAAGMLVLPTAAAFYIQGWRLDSLEREWDRMGAQAETLETLQVKIRQFRPWYDHSAQSLQIVRRLAEVFPKEGSIWLQSLQITENRQASCSGTANSYRDLLAVTDRLRAMPDIQKVTLGTTRGEAPVEFTFKFEWNTGGRS